MFRKVQDRAMVKAGVMVVLKMSIELHPRETTDTSKSDTSEEKEEVEEGFFQRWKKRLLG